MDAALPKTAVAEILADDIAALDPAKVPVAVRAKCEDLLIDVVGLCLTARNEDYVTAALAGWDDEGPCTAIGHARRMSAAGAAFVNRPAGARRLRAAQSRRAVGAHRHRGRRRNDLSPERRGAEGGAQGGLSSDRRVR